MKKARLVNVMPKALGEARCAEILSRFKGSRVLVVGDVGIDRYTFGSVDRISPEAPVPIVLVTEEKLKLGLAANVAENVKTLAAEPLVAGVVGRDRGAIDFKRLLAESKMSPRFLIEDPTRKTVLKERVVSDRQQLLRIDYESSHSISPQIEKRLLAVCEKAIPSCDAVILEDYAKGGLTARVMSRVSQLALRSKKILAVDPNAKTPLASYSGVTLLTPNTREAESLSGIKIADTRTLLLAGQRILAKTAAKILVITRGKDGMAVFEAGAPVVKLIPTYAREVFDVSGAGDTVISVLTLALCNQATIEEAAILGNLAAGVVVGKRGTATVSKEEIREAFHLVYS